MTDHRAPTVALATRPGARPHLAEVAELAATGRALGDPAYAAPALCGWRPRLVGGIARQEAWRWTSVAAVDSAAELEAAGPCGHCVRRYGRMDAACGGAP